LAKAEAEYEKYRKKLIEELTKVERDYLESVRKTQKKLEYKSEKSGGGGW
jgi:predicted metal-dependent phosphoesterase TrpH